MIKMTLGQIIVIKIFEIVKYYCKILEWPAENFCYAYSVHGAYMTQLKKRQLRYLRKHISYKTLSYIPCDPTQNVRRVNILWNAKNQVKWNLMGCIYSNFYIFFSRIVEKINLKLGKNLPMEVCRKNLPLTFFCSHALHRCDISFTELLHHNDITLYWWSVFWAL